MSPRIGVEFPELFEYTKKVSAIIQEINKKDDEFTPKQQSKVIKKLFGLPNATRVRITNELFTRIGQPDFVTKVIIAIDPKRGRDKVP